MAEGATVQGYREHGAAEGREGPIPEAARTPGGGAAAPGLRLASFDYDLPEELIAQHPPAVRGTSRLMVLGRADRTIAHHRFEELARFIRPGDVVVVNDTRVIPARVEAHKETGGKVSILFLGEVEGGGACLIWGRRISVGTRLLLPGDVGAELTGKDGGAWSLSAAFPAGLFDYLDRWGRPPLPPYIRRTQGDDPTEDRLRYQTIYADLPGSVAAPTAGLHVTEETIAGIGDAGARLVRITLDVGPGTFLPIRTEHIERHVMHGERYRIPEETARAINDARARKNRVIAVGTTTTRALEDNAGESGVVTPTDAVTSLFITPGFRFRVVDALVTNFHLPRSTLLLLVSAFAGRDFILSAYRQAVENRYRFYSYGDAMLIR
jgi:S-adenosylmethionine:tRNA ribosyltransferase-isomerase